MAQMAELMALGLGIEPVLGSGFELSSNQGQSQVGSEQPGKNKPQALIRTISLYEVYISLL